MSLPKTRFSCTTLKSIALVLMLLDHIHYFLHLPVWCRSCSSMLGVSVRRCFCFVQWRALPIPMTESVIFCAFGPLEPAWQPLSSL